MFYVIELQTTNGVPAYTVQTAETNTAALSIFHQILAYAALSEVEYHTCAVMDEQGRNVARECFIHARPEEESEVGDAT